MQHGDRECQETSVQEALRRSFEKQSAPQRRQQLFGVSVAVVAFAVLTFATITGQSFWVIEPVLACVGISLGSTMPGMQAAVQSAVEPGDMGVAMATMSFFRSES